MEHWTVWLLIISIIVPTGIILAAVPYLTRRTESFGISITEEVYMKPDLRRMRRSYMLILLAINLVTLAVLLSLFDIRDEQQFTTVITSCTLFILVVSFGLYLYFHKTMKRMKLQHGWSSPVMQSAAVDTSFRRRKLALPIYWFIPHVVLTFATLAIIVLLYDEFPAELIMQYDFNGEVSRVVDKSYETMLWPVGIQLVMIALFIFVNHTIVISKQQIDTADPENSLERSIIFRRKWSIFIVLTSFLMTFLFSYLTLSNLFTPSPMLNTTVTLAVIGIILFRTIWLSLKVGQGGSRLPMSGGAKGVGTGHTDDDRHWKLGIIYYNPSDPTLFLEKRFGVGWTVNFGRPVAWLFVILPLIIVFISIFYRS